MSEATVTSKGQVTIPADIRRSLGLQAQDRLSFTPMPDGTVVLRAKTQSVMALKGILKPKAGKRVAVKDLTHKVANKPNATATIPMFKTEAQERAFWETHDSTGLLEWSAAKRVLLPRLRPSTQTI